MVCCRRASGWGSRVPTKAVSGEVWAVQASLRGARCGGIQRASSAAQRPDLVVSAEVATREELFALVWDRPMIEVAKELGISDVALAKRCRSLQVPTPPRGYWARVRAGQRPKRPPLRAFVDDLRDYRGKPPEGQVPLSEGQWEFLDRALKVLAKDGMDVSGCDYPKYTIRSIDPGLAADVIVRVQRHYSDWIPEDASTKKLEGARYCAAHLVAKLLPVAKKHVLVLEENRDKRDGTPDNAVLVRVTPGFVEEVASLLAAVRDNRLDYVAKSMSEKSHAWSARYLGPPGGAIARVSQIFVSPRELWFRTELGWGDYSRVIETDRIPISQIVPIDLLIPSFFEVDEGRLESEIHAYSDRIRSLEIADGLHRSLSESVYEIESNIPDRTISLMEKLWFGQKNGGLFTEQICRFAELERTMEDWERIIDEEKAELVRDVLGISEGDDVSFVRQGKAIRMRVRHAGAFFRGSEISFHVSGLRYRKDGLVGKLDERLYVSVARS